MIWLISVMKSVREINFIWMLAIKIILKCLIAKVTLEIFLNLDGSVNVDKTKIAVTEGRKLPND